VADLFLENKYCSLCFAVGNRYLTQLKNIRSIQTKGLKFVIEYKNEEPEFKNDKIEIVYSEYSSACSGEIACPFLSQYSDISEYPKMVERNPYQKFKEKQALEKKEDTDTEIMFDKYVISVEDPNSYFANFTDAKKAHVTLTCDTDKNVVSFPVV
jgi:hypothetical protein